MYISRIDVDALPDLLVTFAEKTNNYSATGEARRRRPLIDLSQGAITSASILQSSHQSYLEALNFDTASP